MTTLGNLLASLSSSSSSVAIVVAGFASTGGRRDSANSSKNKLLYENSREASSMPMWTLRENATITLMGLTSRCRSSLCAPPRHNDDDLNGSCHCREEGEEEE